MGQWGWGLGRGGVGKNWASEWGRGSGEIGLGLRAHSPLAASAVEVPRGLVRVCCKPDRLKLNGVSAFAMR